MDARTFHALLRPVPDSREAMTPDDGNGEIWSNALLDALSAAGGRSERGGAIEEGTAAAEPAAGESCAAGAVRKRRGARRMPEETAAVRGAFKPAGRRGRKRGSGGGGSERTAAGRRGAEAQPEGGDGRFSGIMSDGCADVSRVAPARAGFPGGDDTGRRKRGDLEQCAAGRPVRRRGKIRERGAGRFAAGYLRLTSDQDQMTRPTMHFCQSPSKSSMRLKTRGGLSAALSE